MDKKGQYSAIVEKYDFDKSCFLQCYNKSSFYLKSHIINGVNLVKLHDIVKKMSLPDSISNSWRQKWKYNQSFS